MPFLHKLLTVSIFCSTSALDTWLQAFVNSDIVLYTSSFESSVEQWHKAKCRNWPTSLCHSLISDFDPSKQLFQSFVSLLILLVLVSPSWSFLPANSRGWIHNSVPGESQPEGRNFQASLSHFSPFFRSEFIFSIYGSVNYPTHLYCWHHRNTCLNRATSNPSRASSIDAVADYLFQTLTVIRVSRWEDLISQTSRIHKVILLWFNDAVPRRISEHPQTMIMSDDIYHTASNLLNTFLPFSLIDSLFGDPSRLRWFLHHYRCWELNQDTLDEIRISCP